jgi:hypothetical protein
MTIKLNGNNYWNRIKINWTIDDIQRKLIMHWNINETIGNSEYKG